MCIRERQKNCQRHTNADEEGCMHVCVMKGGSNVIETVIRIEVLFNSLLFILVVILYFWMLAVPGKC
jgi:hypothetical protein